ncbi:sugar phosphate isomerase/epimerase [Candidatus Bipolaricaulota bacterium]|nr:sugar phosphate isomerase/epimerase [Candidatus Bipolaricaulota bacterium]
MERKLGVCTWIFGDSPLQEVAQGLSRLGYSGIELPGDPKQYPPKEARRILSGEGLSVFSLTPLDVDLAHPDPEVRRQALDYYQKLLDYAAELAAGIVSCHGKVGRIRPISSQAEEEKLLQEGVAALAERAEELGTKLALEALNRYESHLVNTCSQALSLVEEVSSPALGVLLDTYHMNIEEQDLPGAIRAAGKRLYLFHVADSNRRAPGRGHIPFRQVFSALKEIGYLGPLIVECTAPGPDPFTPVKGPGWEKAVWDEVQTAISFLRGL